MYVGIKFVVPAEPDLVAALAFKTRLYAELARARWWLPRYRAAKASPTAATRRAALAELHEHRGDLRRAGQLLDTGNAIITHHLTRELIARGWNHDDWDPLPDGYAGIPGRRWGSLNNPGPTWTGRLPITLDTPLAERLQRATHHVSATATQQLQELADIPGGWDRPHRRTFSARIVTPADVMRTALIRATANFFPTTDPQRDTEPRLWLEPELLQHTPAAPASDATAAVARRRAAG